MAIDFGLAQPQGKGYLDTLQAFALGRESRLQQQKQIGRQQASQQLGTGDLTGARTSAIQSGNYDMAQSIGAMSDDQQKLLADQSDVIGSTAYGLRQLPLAQRQQALMAAVPALRARGIKPDEIRAAAQDLSDNALDGYISAATTVKDQIAALPKPTDAQRNLAAAGVLPGTPEYREAMLGHVNPSQFMEFGSDKQGRTLYQTRGMMGGGDPASGAPGASAPGGGSVVQRYNNPGAIRSDGQSQWQGMTGVSPEGFVVFDTPENGRRAGIINVQNQARLHGIQTLGDLFQKYAPASDGNDPAAYAARVAQAVGVRPDQPLNLADPNIAARVFDAGIVPVEGGGTPSPQRQNGPRVVASTPPIGDGYTLLTPDQNEQLGLDPNVRYQRSADGQITALGGQSKAQLKPIPSAGVKGIQENNATIRQIDAAIAALTRRPQSIGPGTGALGDTVTQYNDPQGTGVRSAVGKIGGQIIHDVSGAAVTLSEAPRFQPYVPQVTDRPQVALEKLRTLRSLAQGNLEDLNSYYSEDQGYRPYNSGKQASKPAAGIPRISTAAEYRNMKSGTVFIDPNGVKRKKP